MNSEKFYCKVVTKLGLVSCSIQCDVCIKEVQESKDKE